MNRDLSLGNGFGKRDTAEMRGDTKQIKKKMVGLVPCLLERKDE